MPVGAGRNRPCAGMCRSVPVAIGPVPVCAVLCRLMQVSTGADRNRREIERNAVTLKYHLKLTLKLTLIVRIKYDFDPLPLAYRYCFRPLVTVFGPTLLNVIKSNKCSRALHALLSLIIIKNIYSRLR